MILEAPGFENWTYTVDNVDGALQVRHGEGFVKLKVIERNN